MNKDLQSKSTSEVDSQLLDKEIVINCTCDDPDFQVDEYEMENECKTIYVTYICKCGERFIVEYEATSIGR